MRCLGRIFLVMLDFQPSSPRYEAGIVVWYSMYSYASIGITLVLQGGVEWRAIPFKAFNFEYGRDESRSIWRINYITDITC
jgi:hypothetical protein